MLSFDSRSIRTWAHLGSCGAFGLAMCEAAERGEDVVAVTADLCTYSGLDRFRDAYPDRLFNVGIAEEGLVPFATTYGTFASARSLDQVRVSMGYMKLPVKLVGLTAGFSSGILGATHMSCEDLAIMRSIPNLVVLSPADTTETVKATLAAAECDAPVYLRLTGVMGSPVVYKSDYDFRIGKAIRLREGSDVLVFATGPMVAESMKAAKLLAERGVESEVVDVHTLKPLDPDVVEEACSSAHVLVATVEEHSVIGGLGSAVAGAMAARGSARPLVSCGVNDFFPHAAPYGDLIRECGLTGDLIAERIAAELERRN